MVRMLLIQDSDVVETPKLHHVTCAHLTRNRSSFAIDCKLLPRCLVSFRTCRRVAITRARRTERSARRNLSASPHRQAFARAHHTCIGEEEILFSLRAEAQHVGKQGGGGGDRGWRGARHCGAPMLRRYAATSAWLRSMAHLSAVLPLLQCK
jgi:hypothetical protein